MGIGHFAAGAAPSARSASGLGLVGAVGAVGAVGVVRVRILAFALATAAALLAGPARAASPPPGRIVSLVPSLTEAVCLLGSCDRLVAVDRYSNWPASVQSLPRLGGLDDTPLERIAALKPDLVLLPPSSRLAPPLKDLGIATLALPTQSHEDVRLALVAIGDRLQAEAAATALWAKAQAEIDEAARRIPARVRGRRVYIEVSTEPHAAGAASFMGQTLARLGLENIAPASLGPFPRLNPEFIVRARPDVIIAVSTAFERMPSRPGWADLPALRQPACSLPPATWEVLVRPGPRIGEAARIMAQCLAGTAG